MNKIYKVIWSKVKHQYVVVSELAHSQGKQNSKSERNSLSGSLRTLAAALLVGGSLLAMPYTASAAEGDIIYQLQNEDGLLDISESELGSYFKVAEDQGNGTYAIDGQIIENRYLYDLGIDFDKDGKSDIGAFFVNNNVYTGDVYNKNHNVIVPEIQHTITNEDGFHASNGKGTYNTLNKDGLWVGGTKDGEGFHVDNDGNVRTTENMMVDKAFYAGDRNFVVDEDGNLSAAGGNFTIDKDGTTYAHAGRSELQVTENQAVLRHGDNGVIVNEDGVAVVGELTADNGIKAGLVRYDEKGNEVYGTQIGQDGSFSTAQGNFKVDAEGNVNAVNNNGSAIMMNDDSIALNTAGNGMAISDEGILLNTNGNSITVDKLKGTTFTNTNTGKSTNINGDTVTTGKVTGLSNTTWNGTTDDESRAATEGQLSVVQDDLDVLDDEAVKYDKDADGKLTDNVTIGGTFDAAKVTAVEGIIGGVELKNNGITLSDNIGSVKIEHGAITTTGNAQSTIGGVKFQNGNVTADKATVSNSIQVGNSQNPLETTRIDGGAISTGEIYAGGGDFHVDKAGAVTATKAQIDNVTIGADDSTAINVGNGKFVVYDDGAFSASNRNFVVTKDGNVTATGYVKTGGVTVNKDGEGTINGLTNKDWDPNNIVSGQAATEDQLNVVQGDVDNLEETTGHIEHVVKPEEGTDYTSVEGTKFYSDGNVDVINALTVGGQTTVNGNADIKGTLDVAGSKFKVNEDGDITTTGELSVGNGKFTVDTAGNTEVGGTLTVQGYTTINADAKITGNLTAATLQNANGTFKADENGNVTAVKGTIGNIQLDGNAITGKDGTKVSVNGITSSEYSATTRAANENQDGDILLSSAKDEVNVSRLDRDIAEYKAAGVVAGNEITSGSKSIALGEDATADGYYAIAVGNNAVADGHDNIAIGSESQAIGGTNNTAVGYGSKVEGNQGVAVGQNSNALGNGTVALGANTEANGEGAVSIGFNNAAEEAGSIALGNGAHVYEGGTNSVAIGQWSNTSESNVVSVGNSWLKRRITNVEDGIVDSDAATVGQLSDVRTEAEKHTTMTVNGGMVAPAVPEGATQSDYTDGNLQLKQTVTDGQIQYDVKLNNKVVLGDEPAEKTTDKRVVVDGNTATVSIGGIDIKNVDGPYLAVGDGKLKLYKDGGLATGDATGTFSIRPNGDLEITGKNSNFNVEAETGNVNAVNSSGSAIMMNDDSLALNASGNGMAINDEGITLNTNGSSITVDRFNGTTFTDTRTNKSTNINGDAITTGTVQAGDVTVNTGDKGTINGLTNKTWDGTNYVSGQAATEDQLQQATAAATTTVSGGKNIDIITSTDAEDGHKDYKVSLQDEVKLGDYDNGTGVYLSGASGTISATNSITVGEDQGVVIDGNKKTVNGLSNTTWNPEDYVSGQAATEGQLKSVSDDVNAGWIATDNGGNQITVNPTDNTLNFAGDRNVNVTANEDDGSIDVALKDDIVLGGKDGSSSRVEIGGTNGMIMATKDADNMSATTTIDGGNIYAGSSVIVGTPDGNKVVMTDKDITGLTNTTWDGKTDNASRAATEGQLLNVDTKVNQNIADLTDVQNDVDTLANGAVMYDTDATGNVTDNVTIKGALKVGEKAIDVGERLSDYEEAGIMAGTIDEAENSIAIGTGAIVSANNSVALGVGSVASDENTVSVGKPGSYRRIVNVDAGIKSHDAVNMSQLNVLGIADNDQDGSWDIITSPDTTPTWSEKTTFHNGASSFLGAINKNADDIHELQQTADTTQNLNTKVATFSAMTNNVDWNAVNSVNWDAVSALSQIAPMNLENELAVDDNSTPTREPKPGSGNTGDETHTGDTHHVTNEHITGNAQIDGTLNVKGESTFDGNATFNGKVEMNNDLNMNGNKITGIGEGSIAEGSTDAVTGGQLFDMQSGLNSRMDNIENRMNDVEDRIDKVGAMAAAIANLRTMGYDPEAPTEIAVGVGQYKSETGLALGIFHYPNQDFMLSASISTSGDEVMGGIGATWKLGRKSAAEREKDNEEKILAKAEEIKQAAKRAEVKAQADRHAQLLAEREAAGEPIRPVEEA